MTTDCNYDMDRINHIGNDLVAAFNDGYQHGLADARAERKTGKWIKFSWTQGSTATGATISRMYKCSVCGGLFGRKDDRFCYNCGARMVTDDV